MRFHRFPSHNSVFGTPSTKTDGLLFDSKDPSTMTRSKSVSSKWNKATLSVLNQNKYGVVTVYDNSYGATEVLKESKSNLAKMVTLVDGSWDVHTHCEWCGQKINYVAVIIGVLAIDKNFNHGTVHHIGCDCVGKIFGISWYGYRNADSAKKKLMDAAKARKRAIEYPKKYAKDIAWLKSLPEFLLEKNRFLKDMLDIMQTGSRIISKKMENYLESFRNRPEFNPKTFATAKIEHDKTLEKINMILKLVESVDTTDELRAKSWSAYNFVKSVRDNFQTWGRPLSQGQMNGLNKVFVRYREIQKKSRASVSQMKGNPNEIPW